MVDPHDFLKSTLLKNILDIMDRNELDIVISGYVILNETFEEEYYDIKKIRLYYWNSIPISNQY